MSEWPIQNHPAFIWSIADLLRGDYKESEDEKTVLPLALPRRLERKLTPAGPGVPGVLAIPGRHLGKVAPPP